MPPRVITGRGTDLASWVDVVGFDIERLHTGALRELLEDPAQAALVLDALDCPMSASQTVHGLSALRALGPGVGSPTSRPS